MPKGKDTRHHPNRKVGRPEMMSLEDYQAMQRGERPDVFGEGKTAGAEGQLPLIPSGLTSSQENTWKEGYDFGEYLSGVPYDQRNVNPKGQ